MPHGKKTTSHTKSALNSPSSGKIQKRHAARTISDEERKVIREEVAYAARTLKPENVRVAQFVNAVRKRVEQRLNLRRLSRLHKSEIEAARRTLTDFRTDDERLGTDRKATAGGGAFRKWRDEPEMKAVLVKGDHAVADDDDDYDDSPTALTTNTYATFGPGSDMQILSPGAPEFAPMAIHEGPLEAPGDLVAKGATFDNLKAPDLRAITPTIFDGPMTIEPTGVQSPLAGWKRIEPQEITPARLQKWAGEDRKAYPDQKVVMGGVSAGTTARYAFSVSSGVPEEVKKLHENDWEWLHLVAFSMGGIEGNPQQSGNLVAGTYHANSEMILYESAIKRIVNATKTPLWVTVEAHLIMHTHVSDEIRYTVSTGKDPAKSRSVTFVTDPLSFNVPAKAFESIVHKELKKALFADNTAVAMDVD